MFVSLIPGLRARRDPQQQQQQPPLSSPASPALTTTTTTAVPSTSSTAPPSIAASLPSLPTTSPPSTTSTPLTPRHPPPSTTATSLTSRTTTTLPPTTSPEATSQARAAIVASIANLFDRDLSSRAAALHANAAAIEKQERDVARALAALRRDNDGLQRLATEHSRKVLEIGNVQNWAEMLERDFQVVEETLRLVREGSESGSCGSGCDCGWGEGEEGEGEGEEGLERRGKGKEVEGEGMEGVVMNVMVAPEMVPIPESPRLEGVE